MEQNTPITMNTNQQNNERGLKFALIITSFLAMGGVGFGIFSTIQSFNEDKITASLEAQIEGIRKTATDTIETQKTKLSSDLDESSTNAETAVTNSYELFANNLSSQYDGVVFGYYNHWNGTENILNTVLAKIKSSHLTISEAENGSSIIAEAENVISAFFVNIGNGSVPYVYFTRKDGSIARINISENGSRTIEELSKYKNIVSVFTGGDLYAYLIDINGNIYKTF